MAFDPTLADRIRSLLSGKRGFTEKKMFGGLAFMLGDKMCCGVLDDRLVARIGPERYEGAIRQAHVKSMDFTGRPLKGYVYVERAGLRTMSQLASWIDLSISFTSSLRRKSRARRKT